MDGMTPKEQLLYFIGAVDASVDPIRIMKGLFLFTQEVKPGTLKTSGTFHFHPMSYGPCAPEVYATLDDLVFCGDVEELPVAGETWRRYEATPKGRKTVAAIVRRHAKTARYLRQLREWCDKQTFSSLLKAVYRAYPAFAVNSVFKD